MTATGGLTLSSEAGGFLLPEPSWDLRIFIADLQVERTLRVKGDMHIGGVMLKLVEELDIAIDWSDHALWWPKKNCWLTRTRSTLNHYGVQADAYLNFTPMHKPLRVQLPDLRFLDVKVDFSVKCFTAVVQLCKELGIRHSEEMSFMRPLSHEHLKRNIQSMNVTPKQRGFDALGTMRPGTADTLNGKASPLVNGPNSGTIDTRSQSPDVTSTLSRNASYRGFTLTNNTSLFNEDLKTIELATTPYTPSYEAKSSLLYPKSLMEKARINAGWLDSSLSLYEQNVKDFDTLLLVFKYLSFYDLNPSVDAVRINQIYEQAKWSLLTEVVECTEDEMMMFGALQLQIQQQASNPQQSELRSSNDDDIDAALTALQLQLEGTNIYDRPTVQASNHLQNRVQSINTSHTTNNMQGHQISDDNTIELSDYLRFMKLRKFTLKAFKRLFFVFKDSRLTAYRTREDRVADEAAFSIDVGGCDVTPDVNISQFKYGVKLSTQGVDGPVDYLIKFDSEGQYARWMAAFRLVSKGRPLTETTLDEEVRATLDILNIQHPSSVAVVNTNNTNINADEYIAPKYSRRLRAGKSPAQRILESHSNVKNLTATESKMNYIRAWMALPDFGIHYFVARFGGQKKEEILGIASDRLIRIDPGNGDHLKVWRYQTMKAWNVNWEIRQMLVQFEEENVNFACLSADCKIPHEFVGGYTFLSMRSKDGNQTLNEDLFHKLTGGWV